jgi:hypothetical protein
MLVKGVKQSHVLLSNERATQVIEQISISLVSNYDDIASCRVPYREISPGCKVDRAEAPAKAPWALVARSDGG